MKDAVCSLAITFFILGALFDFSKIVLKLFQIEKCLQNLLLCSLYTAWARYN